MYDITSYTYRYLYQILLYMVETTNQKHQSDGATKAGCVANSDEFPTLGMIKGRNTIRKKNMVSFLQNVPIKKNIVAFQ